MKELFIQNEVWLLTIMGGFQRSHVYNKGVVSNEKAREEFRKSLHEHIREMILVKYTQKVSETNHINNIKALSLFTAKSEFSYLLKGGGLNFGVSQKLLNLFLKYLWCLNTVETPPHFPVDRIIQERFNEKGKEYGLNKNPIIPWTQMECEESYIQVINFGKEVLAKSKFNNLAELELNLFKRAD